MFNCTINTRLFEEFINSDLTIDKINTICSYIYIPCIITIVFTNNIIKNKYYSIGLTKALLNCCYAIPCNMLFAYFIGPINVLLVQSLMLHIDTNNESNNKNIENFNYSQSSLKWWFLTVFLLNVLLY